jgi:hypothetical protein
MRRHRAREYASSAKQTAEATLAVMELAVWTGQGAVLLSNLGRPELAAEAAGNPA